MAYRRKLRERAAEPRPPAVLSVLLYTPLAQLFLVVALTAFAWFFGAVANALALDEAPECTRILSRVPPLEELRAIQVRRAEILLVVVNLLPWGLLLIAGAVVIYRWFKTAQAG